MIWLAIVAAVTLYWGVIMLLKASYQEDLNVIKTQQLIGAVFMLATTLLLYFARG